MAGMEATVDMVGMPVAMKIPSPPAVTLDNAIQIKPQAIIIDPMQVVY